MQYYINIFILWCFANAYTLLPYTNNYILLQLLLISSSKYLILSLSLSLSVAPSLSSKSLPPI